MNEINFMTFHLKDFNVFFQCQIVTCNNFFSRKILYKETDNNIQGT